MEAAIAARPAGHRAHARLRLPGRTTDERLVAAVRAGDRAAFETIYDRYHRMLLSFCRHMLGSREESEDAVQQTYLSAYRSLADSSQPVALRPWLFAIARNQCLTQIGRRRERPAGEELEVATEGLADEVERREDLKQLLRDLRELPEDQRAALVLAQLGALDHREIADVIGVPDAKVKALVFQARRSLIASRTARDTSCAEIREQLAVAEGPALRGGTLRRHLKTCTGCREWKARVRDQRVALALLLPVVPTSGLRGAISALTGGGGSGGAGVAGGGGALGGVVSGSLKTGLAVKALAVAAIAGTGLGTVAVVEHSRSAQATSAVPALHGAAATRAARVAPRATGVPGRSSAARGTRAADVVAAGTGAAARRAEHRRTGAHAPAGPAAANAGAAVPVSAATGSIAAARANARAQAHAFGKTHAKHSLGPAKHAAARQRHAERMAAHKAVARAPKTKARAKVVKPVKAPKVPQRSHARAPAHTAPAAAGGSQAAAPAVGTPSHGCGRKATCVTP